MICRALPCRVVPWISVPCLAVPWISVPGPAAPRASHRAPTPTPLGPPSVSSSCPVCLVCRVCSVCCVCWVCCVWFVCIFLENGRRKSIGESMALHSSAARCYGASAVAGACGAQVLALWFVCLSVCPSVVRPLSCLFSSSSLGLGAPVSWICVVWLALRCQPRAPLARVLRRKLSYPGRFGGS